MSNKLLNNIFDDRAQSWIDIPSHLKKALRNMKTSGHEFDVIRSTCNTLKIKYQCPGHVGGVAVHFVIAKYKFAILFRSNSVIDTRKTRAIKNVGWRVAILNPDDVIMLSPDVIKNQFESALLQKQHA